MDCESARDGIQPRARARMAAEARSAWLAKLRGQHALYEDQPVECFRCGAVYPRRELEAVDEIPGYRWARYCPDCVQEIRTAHERSCELCGAAYMARQPGDADGLCPRCCSRDRFRELERVRSHLARARDQSLPATLTLGQWLATVEHFGYRCAYCEVQPFTDLDHFKPLAAGGGTTVGNCVPACARCNNLKRTIDPSELLNGPIPLAAIERVAAYLRGLGSKA
jgi:5-methylcytosine-specific restriction endonuclease McrA